jgi:CBS domain-containing protein
MTFGPGDPPGVALILGSMADTTNAGDMPISTLMADTVVRVGPAASLLEVAQALTDNDVGILVVSENNEKVLGVVSERDVVHAVAAGCDPLGTCANDIAHVEVSWSDATATVAEVAAEMMEQYIRHVLVEADGRVVGVVSGRDLLGAYASFDLVADV